jgi:hypothetical protein
MVVGGSTASEKGAVGGLRQREVVSSYRRNDQRRLRRIYHRDDGSERIASPRRLSLEGFLELSFAHWYEGSWPPPAVPTRPRGQPVPLDGRSEIDLLARASAFAEWRQRSGQSHCALVVERHAKLPG